MNRDWAIAKLSEFIEITTLHARQYDMGVFDELAYPIDSIVASAQVCERIFDAVTPRWRDSLAPDVAENWQPHHAAAIRARSELQNADEIEAMLGSRSPTLSVDAMHPWVWDAARSLWQSGHFAEAVRAATVKLNAETQNKLDRRDIAETSLFQQAFSAEPPALGNPRLRPSGDDGGRTALSVRRGIVALAEGCFASIRNPASHDVQDEISEQVALEQLALVSLIARWVQGSTRVSI